MEKTEGKKMHKEELNFLKGELKKVNKQIKATTYGSKRDYDVEAQTKLWEIREKIMKEIFILTTGKADSGEARVRWIGGDEDDEDDD